MSDLDPADIRNYTPAENLMPPAEIFQIMRSSLNVVKDILRRKRPSIPGQVIQEPKKMVKLSEPREVTNEEFFLALQINSNCDIGVIIGSGLNLETPKINWINVQSYGILSHDQIEKWGNQTFYCIKTILHALRVPSCLILVQTRRSVAGFEGEILKQCTAISDVKFIRMEMFISAERALNGVLTSDYGTRKKCSSTSKMFAQHTKVLQPAERTFRTLQIDPLHVVVVDFNENPSESILIALAKLLTESRPSLRFITMARRMVYIYGVSPENQMSILALFKYSPEAKANRHIFCGAMTSIGVCPNVHSID
mmetsp:Transcript_25543/g.44559  ORF Transcript_25543/g.44559 Transcript_25543/m.44559 type:complete len:310 (+) Transcript_25543:5250-6179(+)